jgi:hypothetical protein
VALCSPWWTLGHNYAEIADLAGFAGKDPQWVRDAVSRNTRHPFSFWKTYSANQRR